MKKLLNILLTVALISSCMIESPVKTDGIIDEENGVVTKNIPDSFDWENMEYKEIEVINTNTSVYNGREELIADNLPLGTYLLAMNCEDTAILIQETYIALTQGFGTKAQDNDINHLYFPSQNKYGTFMAEDLFPYKGDKDFNDVVFGFNFTYELSGDGTSVKSMTVTIDPRAVGGNSQKIGIGLKFYSSELNISSVVGSRITDGNTFVDIMPNGCEGGQSSCIVVPLLDDIRSLFSKRDGFINTLPDIAHVDSEKAEITIYFADGFYPNYNSLIQHIGNANEGVSLFITVDQRSKEIFSKGNTSTDKFDTSLFKNIGKSDFSDSDNFAWVIQSTEDLAYPTEFTSISDAYPYVSEWMYSGGVDNIDWFNYPDKSYIY